MYLPQHCRNNRFPQSLHQRWFRSDNDRVLSSAPDKQLHFSQPSLFCLLLLLKFMKEISASPNFWFIRILLSHAMNLISRGSQVGMPDPTAAKSRVDILALNILRWLKSLTNKPLRRWSDMVATASDCRINIESGITKDPRQLLSQLLIQNENHRHLRHSFVRLSFWCPTLIPWWRKYSWIWLFRCKQSLTIRISYCLTYSAQSTDGSFSGNGIDPPVSQYTHFSGEGVNLYRIRESYRCSGLEYDTGDWNWLL